MGAYQEIIEEIGPEAIGTFQAKAADYDDAGDSFQLLGVKGQFADINRKFWKLHQSLWLDQSLSFEQPEEVCFDMIGHLLLTIYCLRHQDPRVADDDEILLEEE